MCRATATFNYDADGNRVKTVIGAVPTYYIGNYYEVSGSNITKYYYAGGQRVAMRLNSANPIFLFSDNLGSTTATYQDGSPVTITHQLYTAWGAVRPGPGNLLPTDNTYTGQKTIESIGLMFYNARYYDTYLNRWVQPDSIIPDPYNPQDYDRYAYVHSNPIHWA